MGIIAATSVRFSNFGGTQGETMDRYLAWNDALIAEYFPEGNEGRFAFLPVDDDEIAALAEDRSICEPDRAVEDFVLAVRTQLLKGHGQFAILSNWARSWRTSDADSPPYVAGLALCVLAASRMEGDDGASSNNYYLRLNQLLGREDGARQPENFELVQLAWEDLSTWLDEDCAGKRGSSTVRTGAHRHIGYPISQCLLRAIDRRRLPDFFKPRGLRAEDAHTIGDDYLFNLLRAWASRASCPLSLRATKAISEAKGRDRDEILETVRRELAGWDGSLRDARGRKRYPLRLHLIPQSERSRLMLVAELPKDFSDGIWRRSEGGHEVFIEADPATPGWSEPLDIPVDAEVLSSGVMLVGKGISLSYEGSHAIPFREDEGGQFGSFLSQDQTVLWRPHWAVVRKDLLPTLERYIQSQTGKDLQVFDRVTAFPGNWGLAGPFEFIEQPALAPAEISCFAPRQLQSLSLRGGLRVNSVDSIYLEGGEPDLLVSLDETSSLESVLVDGEPVLLNGESKMIRLSERSLGTGVHKINAGVERTFSTIASHGEIMPLGAGSLGLSLRRHSDYRPESQMAEPIEGVPKNGQVFVSGAAIQGRSEDLPSGGTSPLFFRSRFRRSLVIGATPGEIAVSTDSYAPKWIAEIGLGNRFQFVEAHADFKPCWHLYESQEGALGVDLLGSSESKGRVRVDEARAWFDALYEWSEANAEDPIHQGQWEQFVREAMGDHSESDE
jgi:hypothetical protein